MKLNIAGFNNPISDNESTTAKTQGEFVYPRKLHKSNVSSNMRNKPTIIAFKTPSLENYGLESRTAASEDSKWKILSSKPNFLNLRSCYPFF